MSRTAQILRTLFLSAILLSVSPGWAVPIQNSRVTFESQATRARLLLGQHCGTCHFESSPRHDTRALRVFNLDEPLWYSNLSKDQLEIARLRLVGLGSVSKQELADFSEFAANLRR